MSMTNDPEIASNFSICVASASKNCSMHTRPNLESNRVATVLEIKKIKGKLGRAKKD